MPMLAACMQRQSSSKRIFKIYTQDGKREETAFGAKLVWMRIAGKAFTFTPFVDPKFLPSSISIFALKLSFVSFHIQICSNKHTPDVYILNYTHSIKHNTNIISRNTPEVLAVGTRKKKSIFSFLTLRIWCTSVLFPHFCFRPLFFAKPSAAVHKSYFRY